MASLRSTNLKSVASYVRNVGKSISYATFDAIGDSAPSFHDFAETNEELFKEVYAATRNYKATIKKAERSIKNSKIYAAGDQAIKSIFEDLKTGNFYNKKREEELNLASMGSDFAMDDDWDFDFSDDSSDTGTSIKAMKSFTDDINDSIEESAAATSSVIARSAQYIGSVTKANMQMQAAQVDLIVSHMDAGFTGVKASLDKFREHSLDLQTKQAQEAGKFYTESTNLLREQNAMFKEFLEMQRNLYKEAQKSSSGSQYDKVAYGANFDIKAYAKELQNNLKNAIPEISTFTDFGGSDGNLFMAFAGSPLKFLPQLMVKAIIPATVNQSLKSLNEGFETLFSNINARLLDMGKNDEGIGGFIGRMLGLKLDEKTSISVNEYKKGPVPWDGIARKTLIDVIPGHLRRIESALTGRQERFFDHTSGRWTDAESLRREYESIHDNAVRTGTNEVVSAFAQELTKMREQYEIKDANAKKNREEEHIRLIKSVEKMFKHAYDNGGSFHLRDFDRDYDGFDDEDDDSFMAIIRGLAGTSDRNNRRFAQYFNDEDEYKEVVKILAKNKSALRKFAQNVATGKSNEANIKRQIEQNGGPFLELFNGGIDKDYFKVNKNSGRIFSNNALAAPDDKGRNVYWYLRNILGELAYQREYGAGGGRRSGSKKNRARRSSGNFNIEAFADSIAQVDLTAQQEEEKRLAEEEEKTRDRNYLNRSYYDEFAEEQEKLKKKNKIKESDPFLDKILKASSVQEKFNVMLSGLRNLTAKPGEILAGVINKADQRMFDLMFGMKNLETKSGRKAKGFIDFLVIKTEEAFENMMDKIEKHILDPLKNKYGDKFKSAKEKIKNFLSPYGKAIKDNFIGARNKIFDAFGYTYGPGVRSLRRSYEGWKDKRFKTKQEKLMYENHMSWQLDPLFGPQDDTEYEKDLKKEQAYYNAHDSMGYGAVSDEEEDAISQMIHHSARGRLVRRTGLTMVSPGEMIIPASFDKRVQARQLAREKQVKNSILRRFPGLRGKHIDHNASGTVTATDAATEVENKQKLKNYAVNFASEVSGKDKKSVGDFFSKFASSAPDVVGGAAVGGAAGLFIGGPILGAAIGAAVKITQHSDTVRKFIFGDENDDSGLISKKMQESFKKYLPDMSNYGLAGAVTGLFTPFGPVGGLLIGSSIAYAKNNEAVQSALFGSMGNDGKRQNDGMISPDFVSKVKKAFPKIALGAAGSMLLGPFGIVGNVALGSILGFASTTDTFKDILFGEEIDGKRDGGIIGGLKDGMVKPMINGAKNLFNESKEFIKNDILSPLKDFVDPLTQMIKNWVDSIGSGFKKGLDFILDHTIGIPIRRTVEKISGAVTGFFGKILRNLILKPAKFLVSAPFKLLGGIGNSLRTSQINRGRATDMTANERLAHRAKHKFRTQFSERFGLDKTRELDEMLATLDIDSLEKLENKASMYAGSAREVDKRYRRKVNEAGFELDKYLNSTIDPTTGMSLYSQLGSKAVKNIHKAMASGDSTMLADALGSAKNMRTGRGLSQAQQDAIYERLSGHMTNISSMKDMKVKGKAAKANIKTDLETLLGRKLSNRDIEFLARNSTTELKSKKASEDKGGSHDFDDPNIAKLDDSINNNLGKKADEMIEILSYGVNLLQSFSRYDGNGNFNGASDEINDYLRESYERTTANAADGINRMAENKKANADMNSANFRILRVKYPGFISTVPDLNSIPIKRVNIAANNTSKFDATAIDDFLMLSDDKFTLFMRILSCSHFKFTGGDMATIIPLLTKTSVKYVELISDAGFEINTSKDLVTLLTKIKSKDQVTLIKTALENVKAPKNADDLIKYADPSFSAAYNNTKETIKAGVAGHTDLLDRLKNRFKRRSDRIDLYNSGVASANESDDDGEIKRDENGNPLDDKATTLALKEKNEEEEREKTTTQAIVEMAQTSKNMFTAFFGKAKGKLEGTKEKATGILGVIKDKTSGFFEGFKKVLKYLGIGALGMLGASTAVTHWDQIKAFTKEHVVPIFTDHILPGIQNYILPALKKGFDWFIENGIAPITSVVIQSLPKVAMGIVKGIFNVFSLSNLFGGNRKLAKKEVEIDLSDEVNNIKSRTAGGSSKVSFDLGSMFGSGTGQEKTASGSKFTNEIEYAMDENGNPILDENGNYIPVSDYYVNNHSESARGVSAKGFRNAFLNTAAGITPTISGNVAEKLSKISSKTIAKKSLLGGITGKITGAVGAVGKYVGRSVTSGINYAKKVTGLGVYGPMPATKQASGFIGLIQKGIQKVFGYLAKSELAQKIFTLIGKTTTSIGADAIPNALMKLGAKLGTEVAGITFKAANSTLVKTVSKKLANFSPLAIGLGVYYFLHGWNNADTILGITDGTSITQKLVAGLVNLVNEIVLFGLLPTSKIIDAICYAFKGILSDDFLAERDNAAAVLDEWNAAHPEQTYNNLEDYNNRNSPVEWIKRKLGFGSHGDSTAQLKGSSDSTITSVTDELNKYSNDVEKEMGGLDMSNTDSEISNQMKKVQDGKMDVTDKSYWKSNEKGNSLGSAFKKALGAMMKTMYLPYYLVSKAFNLFSDGTEDSSTGSTSSSTGSTTTTKSTGIFSRVWSGIKNFFTGSGRHGSGRRGMGHVYQNDPAIANMRYGNGSIHNTIGDAGCAPVAATNLLNSMGRPTSIRDAANFAVAGGFKQANGGTDMNYFNSYLGANGISTQTTTDKNAIKQSLREGRQVVMLGSDTKNGAFGPNNHFITAKGYDRNGNVIVDDPDNPRSNLRYRESQLMSGMNSAVLTGTGRRRYGFGTLSQEEKNIITTKLHQITSSGESGGDYSLVVANDNGSYSVGAQQLHGVKANRFFTLLSQKLSGTDAETAKRYASMSNQALSSSDASAMKAFLKKSNVASYSKEIQDMLNGEYVSGNMAVPMAMFEADELMDPRSIILASDIGNTGPAHLNSWRKNYRKATSKESELAHVRDSLKSLDSYWGQSNNPNYSAYKNNRYHRGWMNRIDNAYNALSAWDGKTINGNLLTYMPSKAYYTASNATTDTTSSTGSTSATNIFGAITNLGKSVLKAVFGDLFTNMYGDSTTSTSSSNGGPGTDGGTINPISLNPSGNKYADLIVSIAMGEIGYKEKTSANNLNDPTADAGSGNYTKYAAWYNGGSLQAQPWCAMFVSWCAYKAGIPASVVPQHSLCADGVDWFKSKKQWMPRGDYIPKRGDIIYFYSGGRCSHVGIVIAADNSVVNTVEGNTSDGVNRRSYSLTDTYIYGYGIPDYESLMTEAERSAYAASLENNTGSTVEVDHTINSSGKLSDTMTRGMGRGNRRNSASSAVLGRGNNSSYRHNHTGLTPSQLKISKAGGARTTIAEEMQVQRAMSKNAASDTAVIEALLAIVDNTDKIKEILAVLNGMNASDATSGGSGSTTSSESAKTKAKLNRLLNEARSGSRNSTSTSNLLNNMDTTYIVSAMESIAKQ